MGYTASDPEPARSPPHPAAGAGGAWKAHAEGTPAVSARSQSPRAGAFPQTKGVAWMQSADVPSARSHATPRSGVSQMHKPGDAATGAMAAVQVAWFEQIRIDIERMMTEQQAQFRRLSEDLRADLAHMLRETMALSHPAPDMQLAEHAKTQDLLKWNTSAILDAVDALRAGALPALEQHPHQQHPEEEVSPRARQTSPASTSPPSTGQWTPRSARGEPEDDARVVCDSDPGSQRQRQRRSPPRSQRTRRGGVQSNLCPQEVMVPAEPQGDTTVILAESEGAADSEGEIEECTLDSWEKERLSAPDLAPLRASAPLWEWKATNGVWAPYRKREADRIEQAFWSGKSIAYVKSGADSRRPLEVFFADMVQFDPSSSRVRQIRRKGSREFTFCLNPWLWARRRASAVWQELQTGVPRFETLEEHRRRKRRFEQGLAAGTLADESAEGWQAGVERASKARARKQKPVAAIVESSTFEAISMAITFLQVAWVVAALQDTDYERANLYDRSTTAIVMELFFCVFFAFELLLRYLTLARELRFLRDPWLGFDLVCVVFSVLEVVVLPPLLLAGAVAASSPLDSKTLRVFRIGRLFRILQLPRRSRLLGMLAGAFLDGLAAAACIWALLAMLLFAFGMVLCANVEDSELRRAHFGNPGDSMRTLLLSGIFLDGAASLWMDLALAGEVVPLVVLGAFLFVAYFGLLSMLVAAFCAGAVRAAQGHEQDAHNKFLEERLKGVLEVYVCDGSPQASAREPAGPLRAQRIGRNQFRTMMRNIELHGALAQCGTDVSALRSLEGVLFARQDQTITVSELLKVIARLRVGAPALVSHLIYVQAMMEHRFNELDKCICKAPSQRGEALLELEDLPDASKGDAI